MIKKIINHVVVGIGIAFVITLIMLNIFARDNTGAEILDSSLIWMVAGGFYGLAAMLHETKMSKVMIIPLHFLSNVAISFIAIEMMFRFVYNTGIDFSYVVLVILFTVVYIVVNALFFLYERLDVNKINKKLNENEKK